MSNFFKFLFLERSLGCCSQVMFTQKLSQGDDVFACNFHSRYRDQFELTRTSLGNLNGIGYRELLFCRLHPIGIDTTNQEVGADGS